MSYKMVGLHQDLGTNLSKVVYDIVQKNKDNLAPVLLILVLNSLVLLLH